MGWNATEEDHSTVPMHVSSTVFMGSAGLPSAYDLDAYFPPIGNQGGAPTCVDWAIGYSGYTAMSVIDDAQVDRNLATNQGSPKALWCLTPDNQKGQFVPALDKMIQVGVADMGLVPYNEDFSSCNADGSVPLSWRANAAEHRITHYRKLDNTVEAIKQQLSQKHPVVCGIRVFPNFGALDGNGVYSSTGGTVWDGRSAHALVIQGYDDTKGAGAFRVRNSWGAGWNGDGTIWIDYELMVDPNLSLESFFVMSNDHQGHALNSHSTGGPDLLPWVFTDYGMGDQARNVNLNIYNIGDAAIPASADYGNYYMYVNAYNAEDFGFIFQYNVSDDYSQIPPGLYGCDFPSLNICTFNIGLPAGGNLSTFANGNDQFRTSWVAPTGLNGDYYLILFSDPLNKVAEANETNNAFYVFGHEPRKFSSGVATRSSLGNFENPLRPSGSDLKSHPYMSGVTRETPNAYRIEELYQVMKQAEATGVWQERLAEAQARAGTR